MNVENGRQSCEHERGSIDQREREPRWVRREKEGGEGELESNEPPSFQRCSSTRSRGVKVRLFCIAGKIRMRESQSRVFGCKGKVFLGVGGRGSWGEREGRGELELTTAMLEAIHRPTQARVTGGISITHCSTFAILRSCRKRVADALTVASGSEG